MKPRLASPYIFYFISALTALILVSLTGTASAQSGTTETTIEVYAEGLVNPKGMVFTADGALYVAESGEPSDVMVPLPVNFGGEGPIGTNAGVSRIRPGGEREDFVTGLPNIGLYGGVEMLGAGSVTVLNGQLYEVAAGHMTVSPRLSAVSTEGVMSTLADIGEFNANHLPPPSNGDAVPRGNPFDLVALAGNLYITDGNYNRVLKVSPAGEITLLAQWENSPVTVGAAAGPDGNLYVSQFSPAPYIPGTGRIDRVSPDGQVTEGVVTNLTTPIDVAFAPDGTMYVLRYAAEFSPELLRYIPFGGEVQRVNDDGSVTPVVTNLVFPTAMTFGPDGALYVNNYGNESNHGEGQVLRVVVGDTTARAPDVPPPDDSGSYAVTQPTQTPVDTSNLVIGGEVTIVEPPNSNDWGYQPRELTIEAGQAVVFTNSGRISHTATAKEGAFDTGLLRGGESITVAFNNPGVYPYFCQPHPWMTGSITVTGQSQATPTPSSSGLSGDEEDRPGISPLRASLFMGVIVVGIFAAGYAMRRRSNGSNGHGTGDEGRRTNDGG